MNNIKILFNKLEIYDITIQNIKETTHSKKNKNNLEKAYEIFEMIAKNPDVKENLKIEEGIQ